MKAKNLWWGAVALASAAVVGSAAAFGVAVHNEYKDLHHEPAYVADTPEQMLTPNPDPAPAPAAGDVAAALDKAFDKDALATFGGAVIDTASGEVVWEKDTDRPLTPASSTKVLTTAAATWQLPEDERITTEAVRGQNPDNVVIKAAGDVWMSSAQIDELAEQVNKAVPNVAGVYVDTSAWAGDTQAPGWDPENIDEGFVAPMEPAMLYGGRQGAEGGDVPRSHTPAKDVARALADKLGAQTAEYGVAPADADVVASTQSAPLSERAEKMMKHSDNVMAEAIARELAASRGEEPSFAGDTAATLAVLAEHGIDTHGVEIKDNSGLSTDNRIPAKTLAQVIAQGTEDAQLRPLLGYLPVAGGDGTLSDRYADLSGRGYVRAKTGTLTGVSALVGTVPGQSGAQYAFAFLVNDGDLLGARQAQDKLASALREQ